MAVPPSARAVAAILALALGASPAAAQDDDASCRFVELDMTPSDDLQIVVWVEDEAGNYVDTAFITRLTGSFGLGNRPGIKDFNSGPLWPYGPRTTTFPVWANRHGMTWPLVGFQDGDELDLSHPITQSSAEGFYCRPIKEDEALWDAESCATAVFTDKGVLSDTEVSHYPPRSDLTVDESRDDPSVGMMSAMNPFDAVSRATPIGGERYQIRWPIPEDLPDGDYVAWLEVSKEYDQNDSYDYPSPAGIAWGDYGTAYRGQPSVLYRVPFSITGDEEYVGMTSEYVGYGDPGVAYTSSDPDEEDDVDYIDYLNGVDGEIRAPDATITTGVAGSGAGRLLFTSDDGDMYRVKVVARSEEDEIAPGGPGQVELVDADSGSITARFIAPGDDDQEGTVSGYEIRYRAGEPIDAGNFADSTLAAVQLDPLAAGTFQTVTIDGLLPSTNYYVGVRAVDECNNAGDLVTLHARTPRPEAPAVDACFVATAAYGSPLATEVVALRRFRDLFLRSNVPGELLVESYYTFGPALSRLIAPSPALRELARDALGPLVQAATDTLP